MGITRLDHVNLRTANLAAMTEFYTTVLGLTIGSRPKFDFPGAWLYCGDIAIVHLVGVADAPRPYSPDQQLEHFALTGTDLDSFLLTLEQHQLPYRLVRLDDIGLTLCNLWDPDGNHIHIDFKD